MGHNGKLNVDAAAGIQFRAVPRIGAPGWEAQWRPIRAITAFPTFSYMSRSESFATEGDALEFVRRNAAAIVARAI
jgi:hypothetical protein